MTVRITNAPDFGKANPWVRTLTDEVNKLPAFSNFSYTTPNSNVTAERTTIGINENSTASVLWVKQVGSGNTGWVALA